MLYNILLFQEYYDCNDADVLFWKKRFLLKKISKKLIFL